MIGVPLPDALAAALHQRRDAAPGVAWDGVDEWVGRMYGLTRPGGILALVLPDGKSFTYRKPVPPSAVCPECGWASIDPQDVAAGYCPDCAAWTMIAVPSEEQG